MMGSTNKVKMNIEAGLDNISMDRRGIKKKVSCSLLKKLLLLNIIKVSSEYLPLMNCCRETCMYCMYMQFDWKTTQFTIDQTTVSACLSESQPSKQSSKE